MSLFQCDKCGCLENTACTPGYHMQYSYNKNYHPDHKDYKAFRSYKRVLGLKEDEPFGEYCCVCSPYWFKDPNHYGVGPIPRGKTWSIFGELGKWHDKFPRVFYPKGKYYTNKHGNLARKSDDKDAHETDEGRDTEYP